MQDKDVENSDKEDINDKFKKKIKKPTTKKADVTFYKQFDEEVKPSRILHFGVALTKGTWGKEQFKHIKWSKEHPNKVGIGQPDGIGDSKLHPNAVYKEINKHPEVQKHLKAGWQVAEGTGLASLKKDDIIKNLKDHAQGKLEKYGHYHLKEELDESFSLDDSGKLSKDKRHILSKFIDEDTRSADYKMTLVKLPNGKFGWRKLRKEIKVAVPLEPDKEDEYIPFQNQNNK